MDKNDYDNDNEGSLLNGDGSSESDNELAEINRAQEMVWKCEKSLLWIFARITKKLCVPILILITLYSIHFLFVFRLYLFPCFSDITHFKIVNTVLENDFSTFWHDFLILVRGVRFLTFRTQKPM